VPAPRIERAVDAKRVTVPEPDPTVRVEDASLVSTGGPARLALARLPQAARIADAVAAARGVSRWVEGRLVVTAVPSRLIDAAGRVGGAELADRVGGLIGPAIEAWCDGSPDLVLADRALPTSERPVVMGILNVTPDSFSDGGLAYDPSLDPSRAIAAGLAMARAGADLVDVGGESTRPGAAPVPEDEELARVVPVVAGLTAGGATVSIDTTKARVAREAVAAGASIVNDVSAGSLDPELVGTVAELGVGYVLMHRSGTPLTMQEDPRYADVVGEVFDFLADHLAELAAAGVDPGRVMVDPGIGFGKTAAHNLHLLRRTRELTSLGRPVLIGASRKSFIGALSGTTRAADRLAGSLAVASLAVASGARVLRVHDVAATVRAVTVAAAIATA
jgi:dihydropteroate synthase